MSDLEIRKHAELLASLDLGYYQTPRDDDALIRAGIVLARAWLAENQHSPATKEKGKMKIKKGYGPCGINVEQDGEVIACFKSRDDAEMFKRGKYLRGEGKI